MNAAGHTAEARLPTRHLISVREISGPLVAGVRALRRAAHRRRRARYGEDDSSDPRQPFILFMNR